METVFPHSYGNRTAQSFSNSIVSNSTNYNQANNQITTATASGNSVTITSVATVLISNYPITISSGDFSASDTYTTLTGGANANPVYDAGTATATITSNAVSPPISYTATITWGRGDTSSTVAARLASAINSATGSIVTATASGSSINLVSKATGPMADYAVSASVADTQTAQYPSYFPSPSFSVSAVNMTGGAEAAVTGPKGLLYGYSIAPNGGYDGVGNLRSVTDSLTGTWNYTYDNLNRLLTGTSTAGYYSGAAMSWSYDPFGNRLNESVGGAAEVAMPSSSTASYTAASNQVSSSSQNGGAGFLYDAAGDVTYDGLNSYLYDGVPVDSGSPASGRCSLGCRDRSSLTGQDAEGASTPITTHTSCQAYA